MSIGSDREAVTCEVRVAARREMVFEYFVDPVRLVRWMGIDAELDPRPGGVFHVHITEGDWARGEYVAVEPPDRVVFSWGWEKGGAPIPPGSTTVEIRLLPDGDGTLVRLLHHGLTGALRDSHGEGWGQVLPRLVAAVEAPPDAPAA